MYILIWFPKWFWPIQCKICYIIHNAMVCTACVANRLLRYIDNYRYFWNTKSELGFIKICNSRLYFENRHLSADKGLRVHAPKTFWNFSGHWRSILVFCMQNTKVFYLPSLWNLINKNDAIKYFIIKGTTTDRFSGILCNSMIMHFKFVQKENIILMIILMYI